METGLHSCFLSLSRWSEEEYLTIWYIIFRLEKSCPYCRLRFSRCSQHIQNSHASSISTSQILKDQKREKERSLEAGEESKSILELKRDFPNNYLDVALMLYGINIPVYIPKAETYVHHLTAEDINAFKQDPESMPDVLKGHTKAPVLKYSSGITRRIIPSINFMTSANLATTTKAHKASAATLRPPIPSSPTLHQSEDDEPSDASVHADTPTSPPGSSTARFSPLRSSSPPPSGFANVSPVSTSSEESIRPLRIGKHNKIDSDQESLLFDLAEVYSDQEENSNHSVSSNDAEPSTTTTTNSKKTVENLYKKHKMYINTVQRDTAIKSQLKMLETHYKSLGNYEKRARSIKNSLSLACKIMKYCSPTKTISEFGWQHLNADNISSLVYVLRNDIKLSPNTIANYMKVITHLLDTMTADTPYLKNYPDAMLIKDACACRLKQIRSYNAKEIEQKQTHTQSEDTYLDSTKYKDYFVRVFETVERSKVDVLKLLDQAKTRKLTKTEVTTVNGFFNLHSLTSGNRPMVFQYMRKSIYKLAKNHPKIDSRDGSKYYYLASSEHKTGVKFVAFIYLTGELMDMLTSYYKCVRQPAAGFEDYLFLNTNGRKIFNPSNDLTKFLAKYDTPLSKIMNHTFYRKILTTISNVHLGKDQQQILHGMLRHSEATANKHYLLGSEASVPHKLGIPLIGDLLRICSNDVNRNVTSYVSKSSNLLSEVTDATRSAVLDILKTFKDQRQMSADFPEPTNASLEATTTPVSTATSSPRQSPQPSTSIPSPQPSTSRQCDPPSTSRISRVSPTPSNQSSHSSTSSTIQTKTTTQEKIKALIGEITTETPLKTKKDIQHYLGELNIVCDDPKLLTKQMQSYMLYSRNIIRAKEIADALRRLQDKTKFKAAITQYINDKQWSANVKTSEAALRLLETAHEDKVTQKKVIVMPVRNTLKQ